MNDMNGGGGEKPGTISLDGDYQGGSSKNRTTNRLMNRTINTSDNEYI